MTMKPAPAAASALASVAATEYFSASSSIRSSRRPVTTISSGLRQPELRRPARSDSPILPPPRIAMRRPSTAMRGVYGAGLPAHPCQALAWLGPPSSGVSSLDAGAPHLGRVELDRHETARGTRQQVDARQSCPLLVRSEQLGRLLGFDPPATNGRAKLEQAEVADEPVLGAPEPLQADDADRPRADAALPAEPGHDAVRRHVAEPFEVERPAEADDCRRLARREV